MKKFLIITLIMSAVLAVFVNYNFKTIDNENAFADSTSTDEPNFTNLLVFVKFSGEEEFINNDCSGATVRQITHNAYTLADYSVKDYYTCVSGGKVNMQTLYLFNADGSSVTLSHERGYYCTYDATTNPNGYTSSNKAWRTSELRQDWADAITNSIEAGGIITNGDGSKNFSVSDLDKNNDGVIDCITIMYKYSNEYSVAYNDCLWSYQSYSDRVEVDSNGNKITSERYLQMTANYDYLYTDSAGRKIPTLKTMIHEMGHIFGLYDLYKTEDNSPVYYMSAMAKAISPAPQFLSSKEREALGWLEAENISTLTAQGDYTIGVTTSSTPTGIICYKYTVPNTNKILYLEYRKFDGTENKYDSQTKTIRNSGGEEISGVSGFKSGLVCFLVNKDVQFPSNLNAQNGNWQYEVLGGTQATKIDSALDVNEELDVTSNLKITVKSRSDNELVFSVSGSDIPASHSHILIRIPGKDATCTNSGNIEFWQCSGCNKYFSNSDATVEITQEETLISALNHNLSHIERLDSTCTAEGHIEYYECERCNKFFLDKNATTEIQVESIVIGLKPHIKSDWIVDKTPTPNEAGSRYKKCAECGIELERESVAYVAEPTPPAGEENAPSATLPEDNNGGNEKSDNATLQTDLSAERTTIILMWVMLGTGGTIILFAGILCVIFKRRRPPLKM